MYVAATVYNSWHRGSFELPREQRWLNHAAQMFREYIPFGLTYDRNADRLIFEGKLVRYFEDIVNEWRYRKWPSLEGDVDVFAVRDENGILIGVQAFTQQEFDKRNLAGSLFAFQSSSPADMRY